jgi:gamma-glutamylcyclotransferase (GGCT)/AIG2-like uncharacterized protein YtfP
VNKLVFVYGTLKQGYGNNSLLKNAEFIGEFTTCEDSFLMYTNGSFPYVVRDGKFHVKGELYHVKDPRTAEELDWLEGYPNHYDRVPVTVCDGLNGYHEAEMYVAAHKEHVQNLRPIIPNDYNVLEWHR